MILGETYGIIVTKVRPPASKICDLTHWTTLIGWNSKLCLARAVIEGL